jgi:hypothetical protein
MMNKSITSQKIHPVTSGWRNGDYADSPMERNAITGKGIAQDGAATFEGKGMPDTASVPLTNFNCKSELAPTTMSIGVS